MVVKMSSPSSRPSLASDAPIGIFDSGIGGLTVAHAMAQAMPAERMLYFGDTAHMPYGDRSPELVRTYSVRIAEFLAAEGCKAIVIACNSASATAKEAVEASVGPGIPVIDVVAPVVKYLSAKGAERVGVMGTRATVGSGIYGRSLREAHAGAGRTGCRVEEWPTPLLAPLIEEGWQSHAIMLPVIEGYLQSAGWVKGQDRLIDALVLGCTHYPLAADAFREVLGDAVEIVDGPSIVASAVAAALLDEGLTAPPSQAEGRGLAAHRFMVSDLTENFVRSAQRFFGKEVPLVPGGPWFQH